MGLRPVTRSTEATGPPLRDAPEPRGAACPPRNTPLPVRRPLPGTPQMGARRSANVCRPRSPHRRCPETSALPSGLAKSQSHQPVLSPEEAGDKCIQCDNTHGRGRGHRHRRLLRRDHGDSPRAPRQPACLGAEFSGALGDLACPTACSSAVSSAGAHGCPWARVDSDPALTDVTGRARTTPAPRWLGAAAALNSRNHGTLFATNSDSQ